MTTDQLKTYQDQGYILLPEHFSSAEVAVMNEQLPAVFTEETPGRIQEKELGVIRSVYGSHAANDLFHRLTRQARIVEPAMQMLDSEVYVYQFKINMKAAFNGDMWEWHQDFIFWHKDDGLLTDRILNAIIFLDDVNEFNGPLFLIPGSHREGILSTTFHDGQHLQVSDKGGVSGDSNDWEQYTSTRLKYFIDNNTVARIAQKYGIVAPKGLAGSVLFSHPNLIHSSPNNISPFDRKLIIITFNSIENIPVNTSTRRAEFFCSRDYRPVIPLSNDTLLQ